MYSTSEGRWEFCTSNSVRSASSRQGGGSLGCRVGGSLRMRRILTHKHTKNNQKIISYWKDALYYFSWVSHATKYQLIVLCFIFKHYTQCFTHLKGNLILFPLKYINHQFILLFALIMVLFPCILAYQFILFHEIILTQSSSKWTVS